MLIMLLAAASSSLCAIAALLLIGLQRIERLAKPLALMAAGMLLTLAFAHLLPEAVHGETDSHDLGLVALGTILVLTALEMLSGHDPAHEHSASSGATGLLSGTLVHTFCDGIMLATAFATDMHVGLAVTAAIFIHELPQEMGDYALLLECGYSKKRAFVVNVVALGGMVGGALCSSLILQELTLLLPYALTIAGSSFIYVALSALLPRLKASGSTKSALWRLTCLLLGALLALLLVHHH